jgi:hypothetical protein
MKASDRNSTEIPGPAFTICSNLFARENKANLPKVMNLVKNNLQANFSRDECKTLIANLHWCTLSMGRDCKQFCEGFDIESVDVVEEMWNSAQDVSI